ncbi:MAG: alpha/beta fold hydrolase [Chitinophagaceae bacterium]|nr:alpha/beta fold hydrolase [Chitinophagaceae bacterium]
MSNFLRSFSIVLALLVAGSVSAQSDTLVLRDLALDKTAAAGFEEIFIPSHGSQLAGLIYKANGSGKHPTLILLHGYPGNERNLDLAQVVRSRGWNVIYFNYRGAWGSEGKYSFKNCVEDVVNVVAYCNKNQQRLKIDTSNIVLFGHSLGAWVCLKVLPMLPQIKKGFAMSTADLYGAFKNISDEKTAIKMAASPQALGKYFVLDASTEELFAPLIRDRDYFNLVADKQGLSAKQLIMIDEHSTNKALAATIQQSNKSFFEYEVWETDHSFTNKRVSLIKKVITFLER